MEKRKILIIDDDRDLAMIIQDMLEDYGYEAVCADDSTKAYEHLKERKFHMILLDINLPGISGFEVCRELRQVSNIPVIFASARTSENDKLTGLDIGGDDYLAKPYSLKELLSRINALMRRTYGNTEKETIYKIGKSNKILINASLRKAFREGQEVNLSLKEFDLLQYLCIHANQNITKEELLNGVWGAFREVEVSTVAVHIRWLREKLEENPAKPVFIKTVWGIGYRLETEGDAHV